MSATSARLLHDGWSFREHHPEAIPNTDLWTWLPAEVPGHVHLDLQRAGAIPDPFTNMHERTVQWVDERDWTYRCTFDAADLDARHVLRFDGIDTVAAVVLNKHVLGHVDNMFVPHEFDVTGVLQESNTLDVRFTSAERVGAERRARALEGVDDPGIARGLMTRSFVRKAQYMYGWDWGPRLRSCGIWGNVTLIRIPRARITDWWWRSEFTSTSQATVTVNADVEGEASEMRVSLAGQQVTANQGPITITIDKPRRWWPAGQGEQPLYDLTIELLHDGQPVDTKHARIGLREIELVREPDDAGESFFFRVNGRPIFAMGANWIPDDSFPSRTTPERVRRQLELARECGMNMLRVWGGGLYESENFHDGCDELGLLVWQDFPYACALYPEDDEFVAAAENEARQAVRRLRNHTSLALWCGNNESQWLASMGSWGPSNDAETVLGNRLYRDTLRVVSAEEDPTRPYWPGSPMGTGRDPSGDHDGDCHYWNVWHGEGDWVHYRKCTGRFISEFGFASAPDLRTLREYIDDLGADTPGMRWHDKTSKGYETYLGFIDLHYPAVQTVEDLVHYSQLNQADALRFGIEHFRRLRPHTMGTLAWQLNDCWPVQSWAWVDYRLRPKAVWYAAKRFYAPLLLSLWRDGDQLHAHLVNDGDEQREGEVVIRAIDADGRELWATTQAAKVGPGEGIEATATQLPPEVQRTQRRAVIHATFADVDATMLLCEPKELDLPEPTLTATPEDGTLVVESDVLALSVMLQGGTFSDNFFHLFPGQPRRIAVTDPEERFRWRSLGAGGGS